MPESGVHELGLRPGACYQACTVCKHLGVKSGITGVQLARVSSPKSHVGVKSGIKGVQLPRVSSPKSHVLSKHISAHDVSVQQQGIATSWQLAMHPVRIAYKQAVTAMLVAHDLFCCIHLSSYKDKVVKEIFYPYTAHCCRHTFRVL